ncbi:unnamed protein product [Prorocentrum cordatum]|uniref:Uncharacterized protein n=1 Tax=Prorocentrum cordatum TaxID=2364126 RepID=A0ABN9SV26_9DINO|nr:unnamed protein product [Polarella glacialis]
MARAAGPQARPQPPTESAVPNTAGNADVQGLGREAAARAGAVGTGGFGSGKTSEDWLFASKPTPATFLAGHPGFAPEETASVPMIQRLPKTLLTSTNSASPRRRRS